MDGLVAWKDIREGGTYFAALLPHIPSLWEMQVTHHLGDTISYQNWHGSFSIQKENEAFLRNQDGAPYIFADPGLAASAVFERMNSWRSSK